MLHGVLERARVVYGLVTNPAADVEKLREQLDPTRFPAYTPEEVHALVRAAAEEQDGVIYLTAAFTGLRRGELLALRWRHVDFDLEAVQVVESYAHRQTTSPKSGHGRVVPMVPAVAEALARLSMRPQLTAPDDLVFIGRLGGHVDGAALRRRFHAARERVGLRYVRFHDLRHSFGTLGARGAESLVELQAWMGHADIKTTMRYAHYRHQRDAARRLGGILVGPDEAVPSQVDAPTDSLGSDSEPESQKSPANSRAPWSGSRPRLD